MQILDFMCVSVRGGGHETGRETMRKEEEIGRMRGPRRKWNSWGMEVEGVYGEEERGPTGGGGDLGRGLGERNK